MCSTQASWASAALPTFCNTANPYRRIRPSNSEWFELCEIACLSILDGKNDEEGGIVRIRLRKHWVHA
jgi:hypothetical protein